MSDQNPLGICVTVKFPWVARPTHPPPPSDLTGFDRCIILQYVLIYKHGHHFLLQLVLMHLLCTSRGRTYLLFILILMALCYYKRRNNFFALGGGTQGWIQDFIFCLSAASLSRQRHEILDFSCCPLSRVLHAILANLQKFEFEFYLRSSPSAFSGYG